VNLLKYNINNLVGLKVLSAVVMKRMRAAGSKLGLHFKPEDGDDMFLRNVG
jgi:hypothetical protein